MMITCIIKIIKKDVSHVTDYHALNLFTDYIHGRYIELIEKKDLTWQNMCDRQQQRYKPLT